MSLKKTRHLAMPLHAITCHFKLFSGISRLQMNSQHLVGGGGGGGGEACPGPAFQRFFHKNPTFSLLFHENHAFPLFIDENPALPLFFTKIPHSRFFFKKIPHPVDISHRYQTIINAGCRYFRYFVFKSAF